MHLVLPLAGSSMLGGLLAAEGAKSGSSREDADEADGIEALYRGPCTTKPGPRHKIYPYLLRGVEITQPNQVGRWTDVETLADALVSLRQAGDLQHGSESQFTGAAFTAKAPF
jgi:hypothetical protein